MSAQYSGLVAALGVAVTMVVLGIRTHLLARPDLDTRCGACGRLVRRGRACPCTDLDES